MKRRLSYIFLITASLFFGKPGMAQNTFQKEVPPMAVQSSIIRSFNDTTNLVYLKTSDRGWFALSHSETTLMEYADLPLTLEVTDFEVSGGVAYFCGFKIYAGDTVGVLGKFNVLKLLRGHDSYQIGEFGATTQDYNTFEMRKPLKMDLYKDSADRVHVCGVGESVIEHSLRRRSLFDVFPSGDATWTGEMLYVKDEDGYYDVAVLDDYIVATSSRSTNSNPGVTVFDKMPSYLSHYYHSRWNLDASHDKTVPMLVAAMGGNDFAVVYSEGGDAPKETVALMSIMSDPDGISVQNSRMWEYLLPDFPLVAQRWIHEDMKYSFGRNYLGLIFNPQGFGGRVRCNVITTINLNDGLSDFQWEQVRLWHSITKITDNVKYGFHLSGINTLSRVLKLMEMDYHIMPEVNCLNKETRDCAKRPVEVDSQEEVLLIGDVDIPYGNYEPGRSRVGWVFECGNSTQRHNEEEEE